MFITRIAFAKAKSKYVMVLMESTVSRHRRLSFRERVGDKKEMIHYDPAVQTFTLYKEIKKIKSMKGKFQLSEEYYTPQFNEDGSLKKTKKSNPELDKIFLKSL